MPERLAPTARGVRALEVKVVELEGLIEQLIRQSLAVQVDAERQRAALQAVASGLAVHVADERRHVGRAAK